MSINFNDFYQEIPKKRKAKIEKKVKQELKAIQLSEVRGLVAMTQKELAENIDISQAAISKMEKQSDLNISTLRKLIEGVGGQLDVIVKLPNKTPVKLKTFSSFEREGS